MTFKSLISKITATHKLMGAVVFFVGTAYAGINFIYKKAYEKAQEDSKNIMIEQDVKEIKSTTDSILIAVKSQSVKINEIGARQDNHTFYIMAIDRSLKDHYKNSKDATDELIRYMESTQSEVKKNLSQIGTSQ